MRLWRYEVLVSMATSPEYALSKGFPSGYSRFRMITSMGRHGWGSRVPGRGLGV